MLKNALRACPYKNKENQTSNRNDKREGYYVKAKCKFRGKQLQKEKEIFFEFDLFCDTTVCR